MITYELPFFSFDIYALNAEASRIVGTTHIAEPKLLIQPMTSLASITLSLAEPEIRIHTMMNVPWLPLKVMRHVLIHEHVHLVVPPREVDGVMKSHPPEFWELERRLSPDAFLATRWLWENWDLCLKRDKDKEGIMVKRTWRRYYWASGPARTWEQIVDTYADVMPEVRAYEQEKIQRAYRDERVDSRS